MGNKKLYAMLTNAAMRVMVIKGKGSLKRLDKASKDPLDINLRLLRDILKMNSETVYGKEHRFSEIRSVDDFKKNVPVSEYEDFAPYIERIKNGEQNILTASPVLGFSRTSGSSGVPKYIPATKHSLKAYVRYTWTRALALGVGELKKQGKKYVPGRGVFLSPATNETLPNGMLCSNIAEIGAREYGAFYPFILTVPTRDLFDVHDGDYIYNIYRFALADEKVTFIFSVFFSINVSQIAYLKKNWRVIVDDIEKGVISDSIEMKPELKKKLSSLVYPMPERAKYLREQFEKGFDETLFKRLWPNLTVVCSIGNASFKPSAEYVRSLTKGVPFDFSIYGASEGLVAACRELESTDMQLLTDSCFYEFIPVSNPEGGTVTLDKLQKGEKYEILITTQAGLYRYHLKDVVECRGFNGKCPMISFVYRKGQLFNIAGEKFSEEDARNTVEMFSKAHGVSLDNWIFYQDDSVMPSRYCLLVETDEKINWEECIDELEGYMGQCNKRYSGQRGKSFISPLTVRL
ncbi:MAG: GH3 auxin-responsive promoter family protein [Clostridia bacterium]|nr:GH3 auxin-responsive promoter family protein [Clostridia bacterium]